MKNRITISPQSAFLQEKKLQAATGFFY